MLESKFVINLLKKIKVVLVLSEACGGAVGSGTVLQVGRPQVRFPIVSLEFSIDIIIMVLGSTQPLPEMSTRNISWDVKASGA